MYSLKDIWIINIYFIYNILLVQIYVQVIQYTGSDPPQKEPF